jgi:2-dehydropantoate 2-reductase
VADRGLRVRGPEGELVVRPGCVASASEVGGADVAIVTVKAYSLDEVAPQLVEVARGGTVVLTLLNGVDATERLREAGVPADRLVDGVAYLTAFRTAPGEVERKGTHQRLVVGTRWGGSGTPPQGPSALETVRALFAPSSVQVEVAGDIRVALWRKMAVVCGLSVICCLADRAVGPIRAHPLGPDVQARALHEVLGVGRARGVPIPDEAEEEVGAILDALPADFYPSLLHDLRAGRPTEMDALVGSLTRMARAAGFTTPLLDGATLAVGLREEARRSGASVA